MVQHVGAIENIVFDADPMELGTITEISTHYEYKSAHQSLVDVIEDE